MVPEPLRRLAMWVTTLLALPGVAVPRELRSLSDICDAMLAPETATVTSTTMTTVTWTTVTQTVSQTSTTDTTHSTVTTTTQTVTTVTWSTTLTSYERGQLPILKQNFKDVIKADGKLLVKDLMSWLMTRLGTLFIALTIATPLLILILYRCSRRCQKCTARLRQMEFRGCTVFILLVTFLLAAGGSLILGFTILDSVQVTIKEVQDFYLKGFVQSILQDIIDETSKITVQLVTTERRQQLNATLCNPTDDKFVLHSVDARATMDGSDLLWAHLPQKVSVEPMSVTHLIVNYQVFPSLGGIFTGMISVVAGSFMTHRLGIKDVALISVVMHTDCKVRASRATVGLKLNAPLLLSRLPESFLVLNPKTRQQAISASFADPDTAMYHIYNALLGGLEQYRFFEWDSLQLGGPLMTWVYLIIFLASLMLVISITGLVLLFMACCRCRCRSRSLSSQRLASPQNAFDALDSVVGRPQGFVEIDIPTEELRPKPHITRALSTKSRLVQS